MDGRLRRLGGDGNTYVFSVGAGHDTTKDRGNTALYYDGSFQFIDGRGRIFFRAAFSLPAIRTTFLNSGFEGGNFHFSAKLIGDHTSLTQANFLGFYT